VYIEQRDSLVGVIIALLLFLLSLRLTMFPHNARGLLLLSLWFRDVAFGCLIALASYLINLLLIFVFARTDLGKRLKLRWREIIISRLEGINPASSPKDMIDHAARLKIATQRYMFRIRGIRDGS